MSDRPNQVQDIVDDMDTPGHNVITGTINALCLMAIVAVISGLVYALYRGVIA